MVNKRDRDNLAATYTPEDLNSISICNDGHPFSYVTLPVAGVLLTAYEHIRGVVIKRDNLERIYQKTLIRYLMQLHGLVEVYFSSHT